MKTTAPRAKRPTSAGRHGARKPPPVAHDEETGEVLDDQPKRRKRTDAERAEAERVVGERAEAKRGELAELRALVRVLDPACETDDDPPVTWRAPPRMGGEPRGVLLDVPRASGRALAGSRLVLAAREYDGAGPNGGEPHEYVSAFVVFRNGGGNARRTVGVALRRDEVPAVIDALRRWLDALDAKAAS